MQKTASQGHVLLTRFCSARSPGRSSLGTITPVFNAGTCLRVLPKADWRMQMMVIPQGQDAQWHAWALARATPYCTLSHHLMSMA